MHASLAQLSHKHASFAGFSSLSPERRRSIEADLAYIFEVPEYDPEIDEELSAALIPLDD
jgi:hypothetical protein